MILTKVNDCNWMICFYVIVFFIAIENRLNAGQIFEKFAGHINVLLSNSQSIDFSERVFTLYMNFRAEQIEMIILKIQKLKEFYSFNR